MVGQGLLSSGWDILYRAAHSVRLARKRDLYKFVEVPPAIKAVIEKKKKKVRIQIHTKIEKNIFLQLLQNRRTSGNFNINVKGYNISPVEIKTFFSKKVFLLTLLSSFCPLLTQSKFILDILSRT